MPIEKLGLLEQRVTQLIEMIKGLQANKGALEEQVTQLTNQLQITTQELEHYRQESIALSQVTEENQRFQEERGQVYDKLEKMLNGLEGIGL